jgi:hypothetical protein
MGTKIGLTGITFGDATVQNTAATTGVTSLTAGSGISVSGATGAVTVSATGGGVTSVNGQTGAVNTTDFAGIGSTAALMYATGGNIGIGGTAAGSNLRYNMSGQAYDFTINGIGYLNSVSGTALSGTWRHMGSGNTFDGDGPRYYIGLWCRVS